MKLVIVESPAKCRKIMDFLGPGYRVLASYGHVRDLPQGDLGVDFGAGRVSPRYVPNERGAEVVARLRSEADRAEEVILATDPDREGEAIAWHIAESLGRRTYQRATFNAITKKAVLDAIAQLRPIDQHLVDSQQARRVLDRIVGFLVSPTCARGSGMRDARSAGRVQSVAVRMVVEREREIRAFTPVTYFVPVAHLRRAGKTPTFRATAVEWKGEPFEHRLTDAALAAATAEWCRRQSWVVERAERRSQASNPPAPFITATLQQAASVQLKITPQQTMKLAQELYEAGLITYMRTDSTHLSAEAVAMARDHISAHFPPEYLPELPQRYASTSANAQEAHEAIHPTSLEQGAQAAGGDVKGDLYRMIVERFVACQMAAGRDLIVVIDVAVAPCGFRHPQRGAVPMGLFRATGKIVQFDGWRRLTRAPAEDAPERGAESDGGKAQARLPDVQEGDALELIELDVREKTSKAPPRYTEASLIKALEKRGVGRPSTYASIMTTILGRAYVAERKRMLHATELGEALCSFLVRAYAGNFIEADFTNRVEADLDRIAAGTLDWEPYIHASSQDVLRLAQAAGLSYNPLVGEKPAWAQARTGGSADNGGAAAAAAPPPRGGPSRPR